MTPSELLRPIAAVVWDDASDVSVVRYATDVLDELQIPYETRVLQAGGNDVIAYIEDATARGLEVARATSLLSARRILDNPRTPQQREPLANVLPSAERYSADVPVARLVAQLVPHSAPDGGAFQPSPPSGFFRLNSSLT